MIPTTKPPKHLKVRGPFPQAVPEIVDTGPPKIETRSLNFFYGQLQSLHNINLTLADRSINPNVPPIHRLS